MSDNKRKTSSYYVLTKSEKLELKNQRHEIMLNTTTMAAGILTVIALFLSSNTFLTDNMTAIDFFTALFGGSTSAIGLFETAINSAEYLNMRDEIYRQAEREGRVRR